MFFRAKNKRKEITEPWNIGHCDLNLFEVKGRITLTHFPKVWLQSIKYYLRLKAKSLNHEKIGYCELHCLRPKAALHWLIITKHNVHTSNSLQDIHVRQIQWTMNILRSDVVSYWLIIPKYDVQPLNSFQDIWQNHWIMKYRLQWPILILRSNVMSYWLIIPKYDVQTSNSLQDIRQNHRTMKYL